jgi:ArsR family transcriptional regulator, arsenate/arsenite/antimonite-responsive transcriptional repressor / arsenate reductase (thioredoxin)
MYHGYMARELSVEAPAFLRAAGHPLRWQLLTELAGSDRQVHELTDRLRQPQNLVSYHLGRLRSAQLVTSRRSSADGRDTYYRLDLDRCAGLLAQAGAALHPALALRPPPVPAPAGTRDPVRVLFLCTGNSSRSQMAEAFLRHHGGPAVRAYSAGSDPRPVHPHAITAMGEHGIDLTGAHPKHLNTFLEDRFDHVITLCDRVRETCPEFPGRPRDAHWSMPDPALDPDGYPAFRHIADDIHQRVGFLLHTLTHHDIQEIP